MARNNKAVGPEKAAVLIDNAVKTNLPPIMKMLDDVRNNLGGEPGPNFMKASMQIKAFHASLKRLRMGDP